MPYTQSPVISTYETKRLSFISNPQQRSGIGLTPNKDFRLVNMMTEALESPINGEKKYLVKPRPGVQSLYTQPTGEARGLYNWAIPNDSAYSVAVVGNTVYFNGVAKTTLSTTSGPVGFTEFVNSTGTVTLVLVDGTEGWVFSGASPGTKITDADFPTPHIPNPIFLDGYLFLAKPNTQDIYNSDLDNPSAWTAGSFISAEMYPDTIRALSKNNNYLYAIGYNSVEYFFDNANPTGSPLARQPEAVQQFGIASPESLVQTEQEVIFIGETANGGHTVWVIDGFKASEIGIPSVKSALYWEAYNGGINQITAYCIRVDQQKLYICNLNILNRTLVYSFSSKMWHEWASGPTNATTFIGKYGADGTNGSATILTYDGTKVGTINEITASDIDTLYLCEIVTQPEDFGNMNRKFMYRFALVGDTPTGTITIEWSDDDYNSWKGPRNLYYTNDFPVVKQLGNFRRRAFRIRGSSAIMSRLYGYEVDINKGSS